MVAFQTLFSFISILSAFAEPISRSSLQVHERSNSAPEGFVSNGPASGNTSLALRMALTSNNLTGLETALYDVSTPGNKLYGQHLTKEEVEAFVAPSAETKSAVEEWFNANNIQATTVSPAGDWLSFNITVSQANDLFDANFTVFTNEANGQQAIRTLSYSLPSNLEGHVNLVHPTIVFPLLSNTPGLVFTPTSNKTSSALTPVNNAAPSACHEDKVDPDCILALYGLPRTVGSQNKSQIAVSGFLDEFAQAADLSTFLKRFRPDLTPQPTFSVQTVDGGKNPQNPADAGEEANLDIQYTAGIAGGVPVTFISVGKSTLDGFLDIINFLNNETNPPQVLSTSYGFNEPRVPAEFANQLCNAYMQLGARGVSILFSSGDGGVSGTQRQFCTDKFIPTFPSGCPFVTSVGATRGFAPEIAASLSSGGFSNIFTTPSYQQAAVKVFLDKLGNTTNAGRFNPKGRGFPDISAQGVNIAFVNGGLEETNDGTSFSTPIVSSIIGQINALRIQAGKSVLGFLNPLIYSTPGLFTDITSGNNPGCGTDGFTATTGWDPVTGFGTPKFASFQALP